MIDRTGRDPQADQLSASDNAVLAFRGCPNQPIRTNLAFTPAHWSESPFVPGHGPEAGTGGRAGGAIRVPN